MQLQLKDAEVEQLETAQEEMGLNASVVLGSQNSRRGKTKFNLFYVMYIINNFLVARISQASYH